MIIVVWKTIVTLGENNFGQPWRNLEN